MSGTQFKSHLSLVSVAEAWVVYLAGDLIYIQIRLAYDIQNRREVGKGIE